MRPEQRAEVDGCLLPFLTVFGVVWLGIVAAFDTTLIRQKLDQLDAQERFEPTPATVIESRIDANSDGDGTSYLPFVRYRYEFSGEEFVGERYSFSDWGLPSERVAKETVARFPAGAEITAYVDPNQPGRSILDIEGESYPTIAVLLLTPFHCVGLFVVATIVRLVRRRRYGPRVSLRRRFVVVDRDDHLVLRRPRAAWWQVLLVGLGILCAAAGAYLCLKYGFGGANDLAVPALGVCTLLAALLVATKKALDRRPSEFLHVDRVRATFAHPADSDPHPIRSVTSLELVSDESNVRVNGKHLFDHLVEARVDGRRVPAFVYRGSEAEGESVRALIAEEFDALR